MNNNIIGKSLIKHLHWKKWNQFSPTYLDYGFIVKSSLTYHCIRHIKCAFLNEKCGIWIEMSLTIVPNGPINTKTTPALILAYLKQRGSGLQTYKCVTWLSWLNWFIGVSDSIGFYQHTSLWNIKTYISWSKWINPHLGWGLGCVHLSILSLLSHRSHHASAIHCLYYIGCCLWRHTWQAVPGL